MSNHFQSTHYASNHYLSSHYGPVPISDHVHPRGPGRRREIWEDDEDIMAIIVAFLEMKDK